ncbi:MAG: hypothetical protein OXH38_12670, partial [Chloroflexi bacterium]|nr:hypothetical protein [Chloroflexota bacterium]
MSTIAVTALVVLFCGQQAGLGGDSSAADPLTLTLSAAQICETLPAQGVSGRARQRSDGTSTRTHWAGVGETDVEWSVSGGEGPYSLVIDDETRDSEQVYTGARGTASVSCAQSHSESFIREGIFGHNYL